MCKFNSLGCYENEPYATDSPETYSNVRNVFSFHIFVYFISANVYAQRGFPYSHDTDSHDDYTYDWIVVGRVFVDFH